MYDPLVGRFLEEDPIDFAAGDPHLYRYVGNSPTNATDPSGMQEKVPTLVVNEKPAIEKPILGPNGWHYWPGQLKLKEKSEKGGFIVQQVTIKWTFWDKNNKDITADLAKALPAVEAKVLKGLSYWEIWEVEKNTDKPSPVDLPIGTEVENMGKKFAEIAEELKKLGKDDKDKNYAATVALAKLCVADKLDREQLADGFGAQPTNIKPELFKKGQIAYYSKVFFVEGPMPNDLAKLFKSNVKKTDSKTGIVLTEPVPGLNDNPAGGLRNLTIVSELGKDGQPVLSTESKIMVAWYTSKEARVSNVVYRYLVFTWEPAVDNGIPKVTFQYEGPDDPAVPKK